MSIHDNIHAALGVVTLSTGVLDAISEKNLRGIKGLLSNPSSSLSFEQNLQ